jgi:hypothetical protein
MDDREYVLAGNATFTLSLGEERFTYNVKRADWGEAWFVRVLRGPNNESDYVYIGSIHPERRFHTTEKSAFEPWARCITMFSKYWNDHIGTNIKFHRSARCGCCGRLLTTPESISMGVGPVCGAGY